MSVKLLDDAQYASTRKTPYNERRGEVRRLWKAVLERHGVLKGNHLDQEALQRQLLRLKVEGRDAERHELAMAAAGRVQSTVSANRAKNARTYCPDAQPLRRGRPRLSENCGGDDGESARRQGTMPGLSGTRISQLAYTMLDTMDPSAADVHTAALACAECGRTGQSGELDEEDGEFYCEECWAAYEDEGPSQRGLSREPEARESVLQRTYQP